VKTLLLILTVSMLNGQSIHVRTDSTMLYDSNGNRIIGSIHKSADLSVLSNVNGWSKVALTGWIKQTDLLKRPDISESIIELKNKSITFENSYIYPQIHVKLDLLNKSGKPISGIVFKVSYINGFGNEVYSEVRTDQNMLIPSPRKVTSLRWSYPDTENDGIRSIGAFKKISPSAKKNAAKIEFLLLRVFFEDGTHIYYDYTRIPKLD
jgi:hypothetical protein